MKKILIMSLLVTFFAHGYSLLPNTSEQALSERLSKKIAEFAGYTESMPSNSTTIVHATTFHIKEYVVTNGGFEDYVRITTNRNGESKEVAGRFAENHNQIIYSLAATDHVNNKSAMAMFISSIITKGTDQFRLYFVLGEIDGAKQPTNLYIVSAGGSILAAHDIPFPDNTPTSPHTIPFTTTNGEKGQVEFNPSTKKFTIAATSP